MEENYTNQQFGKYRVELPEAIKDTVGSALKYGSIVAGVYSMCKDEKDFAVATIAGLTYVLGDLLKRHSDQITQVKQFSKLEDALRE